MGNINHKYPIGTKVIIEGQPTVIEGHYSDVDEGYIVCPRIVVSEGRCQCEIRSWNSQEMTPA